VRISELIWVGGEAKYFCKRGLTRFLIIRSDLPVVPICGSPMPGFDLPWRANQSGRIRHCEEHSDEAIHTYFAARWIASLRSQ
jgi:hypothetical protein